MNSRAEKMFALRTAVPGTRIKTGVGVIVRDAEGRILLEKRSDCGMWGLLGGAMDPGESVTDTAVREVFEESGFHVEVTGLIGVYSEPADRIIVYLDNGDIRHLIDLVVEARIVGGTLKISDESEQVEFFTVDQLPKDEDVIPPARQALADVRVGRRGVLQ
jgi:ADP-ribose pyrophosphatase YjhB (NUDIX family)